MINIDGLDIAALSQAELVKWRRKRVAMVFQSFALMPQRTVLANAAFGLEMAGTPRREREARAMEVLAQVSLQAYAAKYPAQLSGGMQQRVGLARALAVDPDILLMDEAFSALDPLKRVEMQGLLLDLQREQRRTVLFVSHDRSRTGQPTQARRGAGSGWQPSRCWPPPHWQSTGAAASPWPR